MALLVPLACCFCAVAAAQTPPDSKGTFDGCGVQGVGGDPDLNTQKNRSIERGLQDHRSADTPPSDGPFE
jgi:hypothetical protein